MASSVIQVEGVSKRYRIGTLEQASDTFAEACARFVARPLTNFRRLRRMTAFDAAAKAAGDADVIWALDKVSFDVRQGQIVGVIGRNGSGKSTLLKILSRVTEPTSGRVVIDGRLASLLEVGTGFHPDLSGRDNVYLNGTILGMRRAEIDRKFDEIVDFAGVGPFIDTPVKRYSSGMYVRLAFAVAAHLEPDILVIDEVLAVGDVEFQRKCLGKMKSVAGSGRTVLFVSHNMAAVRALCDRAVLLDGGSLVADGSVEQVVARYLGDAASSAVVGAAELERRMEGVIDRVHPNIRFKEVSVQSASGIPRQSFNADEPIAIVTTFECFRRVDDLRVVVYVTDEAGTPLLATQHLDDAAILGSRHRLQPGVYQCRCIIPANTFGERQFFVDVHLQYPKIEHLVVSRALKFDVRFNGYNNVIYGANAQVYFRPSLQWAIDQVHAEEFNQLV